MNKYDRKDIEAIHPRIINIIRQVIKNKDILIKQIDAVTPKEKKQIIEEFNDTKTDYPHNKNVIDLFEEQVKRLPDKQAVWFEGKSLTYKELDEKSNSLANYLKEQGVEAGDIVSMLLDKSLEVVVSVVAILKLGTAYLPIDITYPEERIRYILKESNAKVMLKTSNLDIKAELETREVIVDLNLEIYKNNREFKANDTEPTDMAYVMYTSGSTRKTKRCNGS